MSRLACPFSAESSLRCWVDAESTKVAAAVAVCFAGVLLPINLAGIVVLDLNADSTCRLFVTDRLTFERCVAVSPKVASGAEVVSLRLAVSEARVAVLGEEPVLVPTFREISDPTATLRCCVTEAAVGCIRLSPELLARVTEEGASIGLVEAVFGSLRRERLGLTGLADRSEIEGGAGSGSRRCATDLSTSRCEVLLCLVNVSWTERRSAIDLLSR